jgi:hypothetical protein
VNKELRETGERERERGREGGREGGRERERAREREREIALMEPSWALATPETKPAHACDACVFALPFRPHSAIYTCADTHEYAACVHGSTRIRSLRARIHANTQLSCADSHECAACVHGFTAYTRIHGLHPDSRLTHGFTAYTRIHGLRARTHGLHAAHVRRRVCVHARIRVFAHLAYDYMRLLLLHFVHFWSVTEST